MFTNNPLGHDYNEPMVDRLLGKAYQTIKEVHESLPDIAQAIAVGEDSKKVTASVDKLTATLKGFKEGTGLFIGHDLGEVGVEDSKDTYIGDNFLSELTKSGTNVKTVGDNVSTINRLAEHINELKAIAEALTSLLTVKDSLNEVDTINQNIEKIKTVANNSSNINSVYDCLDNINALAGSINDFPELIEHGEDIATVAQHISYVVTLGSNIVGFHNRIVSLETATDSLDKRLTAAEELNTSQSESIADHEKRIENIETTTDVGEISVRIQAIEDKNVEQDTALDNETKARVAKEKLLDAKNTEQDVQLAEIKNKNSAQDTALSEETKARIAKDTELESTIINTIDTTINNLHNKYVTLNTSQEITAAKTINKGNGDALYIKNTAVDLNVIPNDIKQTNIVIKDAKNKIWGYLQWQKTKDNLNGAWLVIKGSEDVTIGSSFAVIYDKKNSIAYALAPTTPENAIGREVATASFVKDKINTVNKSIKSTDDKVTAVQSNYVTTNTSQQITGTKTFTSALNGVGLEFNQIPTTYKNGGWIDFHYAGNTGDFTSRIIEDAEGRLTLMAPNGVLVPSVPDNENSNKIPHTKWVNTAIAKAVSNMATVDTIQTFSAIKTFTSTVDIIHKGMDIATTPANDQGSVIRFIDKNSALMGYIQCLQKTDGNTYLFFVAKSKKNASSAENSGAFYLTIDKNGTTSLHVPSPKASSNNNEAATTGWVNTMGGVTVNNDNNCIRLSNGVQIYWYNGVISDGTAITFPRPFKDTSYAIVSCMIWVDMIGRSYTANKTTTGFTKLSDVRSCQTEGFCVIGRWK